MLSNILWVHLWTINVLVANITIVESADELQFGLYLDHTTESPTLDGIDTEKQARTCNCCQKLHCIESCAQTNFKHQSINEHDYSPIGYGFMSVATVCSAGI